MDAAERERLEQVLLANQVKALVATVALGMGFDKPDLGFVIHYQAPASVVAYYQQVGRAGRALQDAYCQLSRGSSGHRAGNRTSRSRPSFQRNTEPKPVERCACGAMADGASW